MFDLPPDKAKNEALSYNPFKIYYNSSKIC